MWQASVGKTMSVDVDMFPVTCAICNVSKLRGTFFIGGSLVRLSLYRVAQLKGGCIPLAGDLALNLINIIFAIFGFSSRMCRRSPHQPSVLLIGACVVNLGLHASDDALHTALW